MKNNLIRLPLVICALLLLSACGPYQLLDDDDPHAQHHTERAQDPQTA